MHSTNKGIWESIENSPFIPQVKRDEVLIDKPSSEWIEAKSKRAKFDWIAKNIITSALSCDVFFRVLQCNSAKEMWDILEVTHEGITDVKRARKHVLKMVAAPSRHVFNEDVCVHFMYIYICFKNFLGRV